MRRAARAAVLVAGLAMVLAGCSGDGVLKIKDPGPVPVTTATTEIDFGAIALKGVSSRTTTSIGLGPGGASLTGAVVGPEGALPGANVRVERMVGNNVARLDLLTQPDGTWSAPAVLGGRYRVRAWRAPDLAQTKPEMLFLQASEKKTVNLRVDRFMGAVVAESIAPNPPPYGQPANLFVLVSRQSVDASGVVQSTPLPGVAVDLIGSGFQLTTPNPAVTDNNGVAEWRIRCVSYNAPALSVNVAGAATYPLEIPTCIDPNAPPTVPTTTGTSTRSTRATTTTRR